MSVENAAAAPPPTAEDRQLLRDFDAGRRAALARVISNVENQRPGFRELMHALTPRLGRAHRIGITGPPGGGKSTLVAALVALYRSRGERVGVVAVDPTSPFTGGALLGDRIRMNELSLDRDVFIRSMATRGSLGGLALTTKEVLDVMDAFGFDHILAETVGVGQSELAVAAAADTTVVVLVPESGDAIQAMKAGLMEASDVFVINKADRPGADRIAREISQVLHLRRGQALRDVPAHHGAVPHRPLSSSTTGAESTKGAGNERRPGAWSIPVLKTVAETGAGVPELVDAMDRHRAWLVESGELARRRRARLVERVREEVERELRRRVWRERGGTAMLDRAEADLEAGERSPYEVAARILRAAEGSTGDGPG